MRSQIKKLLVKTFTNEEEQNYIENQEQNFYVSHDHSRKKFCMNNRYLFFYDREVIEFFCLDSEFYSKNVHKIDFMVGDINNRIELYEAVPSINLSDSKGDGIWGKLVGDLKA